MIIVETPMIDRSRTATTAHGLIDLRGSSVASLPHLLGLLFAGLLAGCPEYLRFFFFFFGMISPYGILEIVYHGQPI
jgi:hypothetical protein